MTRHGDYPSNSGQRVGGGVVYSGGAVIGVLMKNGNIRYFEPDFNLFIPKGAETIDFFVVETDPSLPGLGPIPMKLTASVGKNAYGHGRACILSEIRFERCRNGIRASKRTI